MLLLKALILVFVFIRDSKAARIVCYFSNWSQYRPGDAKFTPSNVDPNLCTHVIYSFAKLTDNKLAIVEWDDEAFYKDTVSLKKINPNLKVMIAVGGWNVGSDVFSDLAANSQLRNEFVTSSIAFLKKYGFDGLDMDWEYPASRDSTRTADKENFATLVKELKSAFVPQNLLVSAAVAINKDVIDAAYDVPSLSEGLDFLNVMAYDFHGSWESFTGHNAPLYARKDENEAQKKLNVDFTIKYWISKGFSKDKINLGIPTYARTFKLTDKSKFQLGDPSSAPGSVGPYTSESGFLGYLEVCKIIATGYNINWNDEQKIPFANKDLEWIGYDDERSVSEKVNYAKSNNLGGIMFWTLDLDDFNGKNCNKGNYTLIKTGVSKFKS